ncbi:MAG: DUF58 domain-containing protein [Methylococcales bacterium]|nr:DUF58 domain-containing protein [Methylococcales bacterium]MBT7445505.1 DUF58 domain-containing protein [Methylococcales bacterium]
MDTLKPSLDDLLELRHQAQSIGLASSRPVNSVLSGLYKSVFRGQGVDFEEVREYREGDEIRNMDWRVTARTGKPHLKVFREERQRTVMICVDVGVHMNFGTRGTFKSILAAQVAALLGWAASENHDKLGGILFGDPTGIRYFQASNSRRSLWQLLRSLSDIAEKPCTDSDPLLTTMDKLIHGTPTGGLIFLLADMSQEIKGIEQRLGHLIQRHEVVLIPIDDIADKEMPAMGKMIFSDMSGREVEIDTDDEAGRQAYYQSWLDKRKHLARVCNRLGADMIPMRTHEDVHRSLTAGLRRRAFRMASR